MTYYIACWHFVFHYIFSEDNQFPTYDAVINALRDKKAEGSTLILANCHRRFWLTPASNLNAMMPGLLDKVDSVYQKKIQNQKGISVCDPKDVEW